jgi:DNA-binding transcriptional ArsR family regulator
MVMIIGSRCIGKVRTSDMADWDFLTELSDELRGNGRHDLPVGSTTIISDRILAALSREDRLGLEEAQAALEKLYLTRLAAAPRAAASAARGDDDASPSEQAAFALGLVGLSHAVVARAASRRIDDAFERRLRSKQLERYVRLLVDAEMSGRELAERLDKDAAEVSRRLKMLRQMGAVECRREGNRVLNFLTPAARAVARARNMGALGSATHPVAFRPDVFDVLDSHRRELPEALRGPLILVASGNRRVA